MRTKYSTSLLKDSAWKALNVAAAVALFATAAHTFADPTLTMAPPVDSSISQTEDGQPVDAGVASQDSVFNWKEVPASQNVPIRRAVFDRGGYQLYDTAGETIVVPFSNNNLYVMKFGVSQDGTTYFVNEGDAPVLYVPRDGYLENASVPGARWFPFPQDFQPEQPVFLGIAPSWDDYCTMGWYPDMVFYGGYWGDRPYFAGSVFGPTFGLSIFFGGHHYDGWGSYHHYYSYHPAPYRLTIVNRNVYHFGGGYGGGHGDFRGAGHSYSASRGFGGSHGFGGDHVFNGTGHPYYAHRTIAGDRSFNGIRTTAPTGGRGFGGPQASTGNHSFGGSHTFQGARSFSSGSFARPSAEGGHTFNGAGGGGHFDGPRTASRGGGSFGGARPNSNGGGGHSSENHSDNRSGNGGGDHSGGDHGGGDHGNHH